MIDKVVLSYLLWLDVSMFSPKFKYQLTEVPPEIDSTTGEILKEGYMIDRYIYTHNGLKITYSNVTGKLIVCGRLINILKNRNLVCNLTDYTLDKKTNLLVPITSSKGFIHSNYSYQDTTNMIVSEVNNKLSELTGVPLDISNFKPDLIETSFNLFDIKNNSLYIQLFNKIFDSKKSKNHKSHIKEQGLSDETSFYVKTRSQYKKNMNTNYTVNFYDKHNQLRYYKNKPNNKVYIDNNNLSISKNVLRLEIQACSKELSKRNRVFKEYLDIYTCLDVVVRKYNQFICSNENADFYSYSAAKNLIESNQSLSSKDTCKLLEYIRDKHASNKKFSDTKERKYQNLLLELNIHPYFIPTKWGIDYLESPIKLLKKQYNLY